ncbi:GNAT family N-acetyltransferase [Phaeobacter gallaeciensis]|uniref:GNAT family N-acetyltransferase n=2 Tax=Roseobacteraceae TaxID=2854170 RepID=A0A366WKA7_9RHOB|nr:MULTISPECIES: GNAT family N-acetyltransferase [Roseobacteraceae]MBT3140145.1 GNAT family N-acetyltransferase [Falsiruegeria litorea]MBT8169095.1 GNAT family N-acetyltransferase [Falsiruegeria litorea]RBW50435.1 GNAT family N-acetyltransferase [Phaeobacter gallaeciensis]
MIQIPTISTPRLTLRPLEARDFASFSDFFASDRSKFVGGPATAEQSWRMLAGELGHWQLRGYGRWAVEETATGKLAGVIGPWNPHGWPEPELGWDLMNGFEGQGYATEAALAAREYAYDTLGWTTAISLVAPENNGSRSVAKRMGATYEGLFDHERHGTLEIWRHPAPNDLTAGGMEAYA